MYRVAVKLGAQVDQMKYPMDGQANELSHCEKSRFSLIPGQLSKRPVCSLLTRDAGHRMDS